MVVYISEHQGTCFYFCAILITSLSQRRREKSVHCPAVSVRLPWWQQWSDRNSLVRHVLREIASLGGCLNRCSGVCVCCCVWHSPMCTSHSENFMAVNKFWSKPHHYGLLMQEIKPRWHIRHLFIFSGNKMFPSLKNYIVMFKSMHCIKNKKTKKQKTNIKHTWASYNGLLCQASIGFSWWNKIFQSVIQLIRSF